MIKWSTREIILTWGQNLYISTIIKGGGLNCIMSSLEFSNINDILGNKYMSIHGVILLPKLSAYVTAYWKSRY